MPQKSPGKAHVRQVATILVVGALLGLVYRTAYYGTTTLTIDTPQLDWYAHREFSSDAHFYFFLPMFWLESRFDRSNPGYVLLAEVTPR